MADEDTTTEVSTETTEVTTEVPAGGETASSENNEYANLFDDFNREENDDSEETVTATTEETPTAEPEGDTKPEEEQKPAEASEDVTEPTAESTEAGEQSEEEPTSETDGQTRAEVEEQIQTAEEQIAAFQENMRNTRDTAISVLSERHYGKIIDDDLWTELDESPRTAVPKLLSMVYMDAVQGISATILSQIPNLVKGVNAGNEADSRAESAFFEEFPMLNDSKFSHDIETATKLYVQLNPTSSLEERIAHVGTTVCLKNKLNPVKDGTTAATEETTVPGGTGKPGAQTQPSQIGVPGKSDNQFTALAEEWDEDE